ncbi:UBX domain-containing protein 2 [Metschnikowia aff. pulcherrima]|uniref:UBX domain-containing protein 2 n=1 Tax=Metschnikowia aff. pulcherrima TaxID=2163413 RepID=A0A4P6XH44_9ASCO|nr:UBX domain-containing protein 2 [Metschnikowia aff. pulcherrima]
MESLSPSQHDALNEFVVVTGTSIDDDDTMTKTIALLSHHNFDLNNSVLAFFENGLELPNTGPEPTPEHESQSMFDEALFSSGTERFENGNLRNLQGDFALGSVLPRLPKAPRISNKWQLDLGIHVSRGAFQDSDEKNVATNDDKPRKVSILWIIFWIVPKTFSILYSAFRYFFGLDLGVVLHDSPRLRFNYDAYDATYDVAKDLLPEETISTYNITFEKFNESHESSQRDFNFLLVVLCDDKSARFTQKLLQAQGLKDLLGKNAGHFKESQLFVNNIDKSPEAFEVSKTYGCRRIPFVLLLGNVSRDPSIMSSMSVIYKANCAVGDDEEQDVSIRKLVRNLSRNLNDYNPQLVTKRFDKQEIELSRIMKDKQDEAYLESLESDKVKKVEKEIKRREDELQKKLKDLRKGFIKHLVETHYFDSQIQGLLASDLVRISIKLPDGRRIVQKFAKSSTMCEIYLFVETQLQDESDDTEPAQMSVAEFLEKYDFSFELFKPVPKCSLPSTGETIQEYLGLKSGDSVLFEYIDVDEDETT